MKWLWIELKRESFDFAFVHQIRSAFKDLADMQVIQHQLCRFLGLFQTHQKPLSSRPPQASTAQSAGSIDYHFD
jgi:hypothetical protein